MGRTELIIYPNPVKNDLFISLVGTDIMDDASVAIFDYTGRKVFEKQLPKSEKVWCLENLISYLKTGFYVVQIHVGKGKVEKKLLISP